MWLHYSRKTNTFRENWAVPFGSRNVADRGKLLPRRIPKCMVWFSPFRYPQVSVLESLSIEACSTLFLWLLPPAHLSPPFWSPWLLQSVSYKKTCRGLISAVRSLTEPPNPLFCAKHKFIHSWNLTNSSILRTKLKKKRILTLLPGK